MTTTTKLAEQAKRHFYPIYVKLCRDVPLLTRPPYVYTKGYLKAGTILSYPGWRCSKVSTVTGEHSVKLNPEDFDVLLWRFWPPLPSDRKKA